MQRRLIDRIRAVVREAIAISRSKMAPAIAQQMTEARWAECCIEAAGRRQDRSAHCLVAPMGGPMSEEQNKKPLTKEIEPGFFILDEIEFSRQYAEVFSAYAPAFWTAETKSMLGRSIGVSLAAMLNVVKWEDRHR